jgi:hypothetical protein
MSNFRTLNLNATGESGEGGGEVELSFNIDVDSPTFTGEIFLLINEPFQESASVVLTQAEALQMLEHLNSLLGNPLSYGAPMA